jgi:hypothetical protein
VTRARLPWPCVLLLLAGSTFPLAATAADIAASAPTELSVTVYRAPARDGESLNLDGLEGFALVSETRTVSIPAGESRVRFEGVADGIQAVSAILTGLPTGIIEKNRDARVLSPSALVAATVGRHVILARTNPKTGKVTRLSGTLRSAAEGVIFQSPAGIEALRCSGLPETFDFDPVDAVAATPTLSVLVRSPRPLTATVRLSYLAQGFDWMANYTASVAEDGKTIDLGAWVTLANSNSVSFPRAQTQVVAGRLNRESGAVEPLDQGEEILAQCWPLGTTSDIPEQLLLQAPPAEDNFGVEEVMVSAARRSPAPMMKAMAAAKLVEEEQLGDLKLYRVPDRTSVASRQLKQVRLMDRHAIPVELLFGAELPAHLDTSPAPMRAFLRTRNDSAHHLGLPLPSGQVSAFFTHDASSLLVNEGPLHDTALDQEVEIDLGHPSDVQVATVARAKTLDRATIKELPLIPGVVHLRSASVNVASQIDITNARNSPANVEIGLNLSAGERLVRADHVPTPHNGRPTFRLTVPAGEAAHIRYQTEQTSIQRVPQR